MTVAKKKKGGITPFVLGIIATLILGWWIFPHVLFSQKDQPFNYNHKLHLEEDLSCNFCHKYREDGSFAGKPTLDSCKMCHMEVKAGTPAEKTFVNDYVKKGKEVPWKVYQKQPDNVYFSHIAHREYECAKCHPEVGHSESLPPYYENKITGYSKQTMKMDKCEQCHAKNNASNACYVCHK